MFQLNFNTRLPLQKSGQMKARQGVIVVLANQGSEGLFGRLEILMNNAGAPAPTGSLETLPIDGFDQAMQAHARGAFAHIKYVAPHMRAQKSASIINVGSVAGHRAGYSSSLIYSVARAAIIHMTRCAVMELSEDNVRANSI